MRQLYDNPSTKPKIVTLKQLWPLLFVDSFRFRFCMAFLAMIASKLFLMMVPLTFKSLIDLFAHRSTALSDVSVLFWVIAYGVFRILSSFTAEIRDTQMSYVTQNALRRLGLLVFDHLHALSLRFHLDRQTGGVARVIERGTKSIETLMMFSTMNIIPTFFESLLVGIFVGMIYTFNYTVVVLITMCAYILFTLKLTEWRIGFVRKMNEEDTKAQAKAIDSLLNFETVKYFGNEEHEHQRFDQGLQVYEKTAIQSRKTLAILNVGQAIILSLGLICIMTMASRSVLNGNMQLGDLVAVNAYLIQLTIPLLNLGFAYREIKLALVNIDDMFQLLKEPLEIKDEKDAKPIDDLEQGIQLDHVDFHYHDDRPILKNLSFSIDLGKTVAVVGSSGAGKSTLSRLLFRFYDVTQGQILFDGKDIRTLSQKSLRSLIGIVPQDTVLFNDTIYYNIAYGHPSATLNDVIEVSKKAEIYDFIQSLPKGFDTIVGERGLKLSGGEKQRVAIARTLLKKPKFFIFDEATSALDTKTEKAIQENLERISKNVTTLIIAHRLSTVIHADRILVLEKGRIVESGSHEELLKKQGHYAQMWERQLSGYEQDDLLEGSTN